MTNKLPISNELLVRLAGKPAFNRGMDYFKSGNIIRLSQKGNTVTAEIAGSEVYRVKLKWTSSQLEGACDCPASDGFDFCKHCVAVALALQETQAEQEQLSKGGAEDRIRAYLLKQDKQKLTDWLLELIETDRALFQQWSLRADRELGVVDVGDLKKRITRAIPYNRDLYRYNQVRNYFAQVDILVDHLSEMSDDLPPEDMLKLTDYALQRINRALETIDDSGGFRMYAVDTLQAIHIHACNRLGWPKKKLVSYLSDIVFSDGDKYDLYPDIPFAYLDALGDEGLSIFTNTLQTRWDALPPLKPGADFDDKWPYMRLQRMLEEIASQHNDYQAIIRIREKTATRLYDYLQLAEICLDAGDYDAAELWLEKCRHSGDRDYRFNTERLAIRLSIARELWPEALEQQWVLYQKSQAFSDYLDLLALSSKAGDSQNWRDKAIQLLQQNSKSGNPMARTTAASSMLEIYLHHDLLDEACKLVAREKADPRLLLQLAWKICDQPERAFPLFQRVIESRINQTNNDAYRQAIELMMEMANKFQTSRQQQLMQALLEQMRQQYRAKRNFIKWLNEAFR